MDNDQEKSEGRTIAKAILIGDVNAWGDFLFRYGSTLARVAEKHSRSASLQSFFSTEDIVNGFLTDKLVARPEVMLAPISRGEGSLKPRLLSSLKNYCKSLHRRKKSVQAESTLDATVDKKTLNFPDIFQYEIPEQIQKQIAKQQAAIRSTFQEKSRVQVPQREVLLLQERIWLSEQFAAAYCKDSDTMLEKGLFAKQLSSLYPWTDSEASVPVPEKNEPLSKLWQALTSVLLEPPFRADAATVSEHLEIPPNTWTKWVGRARKRVIEHVGGDLGKKLFPNWPKRLFSANGSIAMSREQQDTK